MRGVKDSLNVAVAFGIVAHHVGGVLERTQPAAATESPA
jgi:tRNA G18 (ribose-2'-O)-methylase SpoU